MVLVSLINYVTICLLAIDLIAGAKVIRLMGRAVKVLVMEADKNLEKFQLSEIDFQIARCNPQGFLKKV